MVTRFRITSDDPVLEDIASEARQVSGVVSNVSGGGWIGAPDGALTTIVTKKTGKEYRATDELWLAVQCNPRTSEMMMPLEGAADFTYVAGLESALRASPFSKVFVVTYGGGTFEWSRWRGWRKLQPGEM